MKEENSSRVFDALKRPALPYNIFIQHMMPDIKKNNPKKEKLTKKQ
jgi:hypothetical protein